MTTDLMPVPVPVESGNYSLTANLVEPGEIIKGLNHVQKIVREAMRPAIIENGKIVQDGDYGIIPGCGDKKALRKSGVEKLLIGFGLVAIPRTPNIVNSPNGHREITVETEIRHMVTGRLHTVGLGSCSTMEGKYRWRNSERVCPACGQPAIIKGKAEYGGGWRCWPKKGGCNQKFADGDIAVEGQQVGKEENPDIADTYNTVLKMAAKRSMADGAEKATASSGMFDSTFDDDFPSPFDQGDNSPGRPAGHVPSSTITECKTTGKKGKMLLAYCKVCPKRQACPERQRAESTPTALDLSTPPKTDGSSHTDPSAGAAESDKSKWPKWLTEEYGVLDGMTLDVLVSFRESDLPALNGKMMDFRHKTLALYINELIAAKEKETINN